MKITAHGGANNDISIFMNGTAEPNDESNSQLLDGKSVYAGNTNISQLTVDEKREQARKEAWKIISEQFNSDTDIEKSINDMNARNNELKEQIADADKTLSTLNKQKQALMDEYGVTEDNISEAGDDLKAMYDEIDKQIKNCNDIVSNSQSQLTAGTRAIRDTKIEILKQHGMVDSAKLADGVLEAAGDDIIGDLVDDAMEHIDEDQEKRKEEAEKLQEKAEKEQEVVEANQKDNQEKTEKLKEELDELTSSEAKSEKSIDDLKEKLKLLEEDLKGLAVDDTI